MKPIFLLTICLCFSLMLQAQISKTVEVTAGNLKTTLTPEELTTVFSLTLIGTIDAWDLQTIRDMPLLTELDLSNTTITATYMPVYGIMRANWIPGPGSSKLPQPLGGINKPLLTKLLLPSSLEGIGTEGLSGCSGLTYLTIPPTVTQIGWFALSGCSGLTSLTIPSSVKSIGNWAFSGCSGIKEFTLPPSLTDLYGCRGAFSHWSGLTTVTIPSSITDIGRDLFSHCGMTTLILPSSLNFISEYAFGWCTKLASIYSYKPVPIDLSNTIFWEADITNCIVYVPFGSKKLYEVAQGWKDFKNIVEMPVFNLSSTNVSVAPAQSSTAIVELTTYLSWEASSDQPWLTVSPTSGEGIQTLTFTAEVNTLKISRKAVVSVLLADGYSQTIIVTQDGNYSSQIPIADAGSDQSVVSGSIVSLNGSASSDPDNDAITYLWTAPEGITLSSAIVVKPTFTAPLASDNTDYTFTLMVSDGTDISASDQVIVRVLNSNSEQHFIQGWTGDGFDYMNFNTFSAKINEVDLQQGDEIGIFDGTMCVGVGILTQILDSINILDIKVSRDDPATPEIDGYISGHRATFKIWDASEQKEYSAVKIIYNSGDNVFTSGTSTWYHIEGYTSMAQEIALKEGWNIFSLNVMPENINMVQVVQSLIDTRSLVNIQNESGNAIEYISGTSTLINNIGNWGPTEGYKIKLNTPAIFSTTGVPIFQPVQINLMSGWNIMSYPASILQDALVVFNNLINSNQLIKVQDETGFAIEIIPGTTEWLNNIGNLTPGKGYRVRVAVNDILTVNPSLQETDGKVRSITTSPFSEFYKTIWKGNGLDHMNIYLSETSNTTSLFKAGNEIGIFDGSICVGAGVIINNSDKFYPFVVSADDPTTPEIDGFINGHTINIRVLDSGTRKEISGIGLGFYPDSNLVFEPMGTASININSIVSGLDEQIEGATFLGNNYPNPFKGRTTIPFVVEKEMPVDISIYDLLGKKLTTLVHGNLQPGSYTTQWDAGGEKSIPIKPGVYVCKMQSSNNVFTKLIVVQ